MQSAIPRLNFLSEIAKQKGKTRVSSGGFMQRQEIEVVNCCGGGSRHPKGCRLRFWSHARPHPAAAGGTFHGHQGTGGSFWDPQQPAWAAWGCPCIGRWLGQPGVVQRGARKQLCPLGSKILSGSFQNYSENPTDVAEQI